MAIDDQRVARLTGLIKDSFRVRPNHDPIYVDVGDHLNRLGAKQHQVIFGRRGSGKSCLLVHYSRRCAGPENVLSIYIDADEVKTLPYPDLLIRLLLTIGEKLESATSTVIDRLLLRRHAGLPKEMKVLRRLLDQPEAADVSTEVKAKASSSFGAGVRSPAGSIQGKLAAEEATSESASYTARKIEVLERHLQDYKRALAAAIQQSKYSHAAVIVDDFYLIPLQWQAKVIDYLHRLFRGTDLYIKIGTVRHRTSLVRYEAGQTIGVEIAQDVEAISLDQTFEDIDATKRYLTRMLDSMAEKVGFGQFCSEHFSDEALLALTLASGGVPRDFLNIFVEAVDEAKDRKARWLTPTLVYKGAGRVSYQTKLSNLRNDVGSDASGLELVFRDLLAFCLKEKRKTAFLVSQEDVANFAREHELIQQLMDFKLVHVIEPDTSAASGRPGRHEAYTLDFALFMEPRLRNIEHVEFWRIDDQRRRMGLREAPVYPLQRANETLERGVFASTEKAVDEIRQAAGIESAEAEDGHPKQLKFDERIP